MSLNILSALAAVAGLAAAALLQPAMPVTGTSVVGAPEGSGCPSGSGGAANGGLELPPGFCATIFADNLGHVRHLAVAPDGTVYANVWSGPYYPGAKVPQDGFLLALKDTGGQGVADKIVRFGDTPAQGSAGGTGVAVWKGWLYAEVNDRIVRYRLTPGKLAPEGPAQTIVSGLPLGGDHPMHPFMIDPKGNLFVDMGSSSNSCQTRNRQAGVAGADPCVELETRAGIWRYAADRTGQVFSRKERYATGLRNGEGLDYDSAGRLYATQHGRDQLPQNWPALYPDTARATELPSEELVRLRPDGDYGWPYCYFDGFQNKLVLAPEYGGDGGKAVGRCAGKLAPVAAFPAHWAPNALAIYRGSSFPADFRDGAFIAFHGSWNRAPAAQDGYKVVFQPMRKGRASGPWVIFADGFAGDTRSPGKAAHRPMGLAVAPDGALLISDDVKGRIWRVTWSGHAVAGIAAAPAAAPVAADATTTVTTAANGLAPVAGTTSAQVARGASLYQTASCSACHGADARGTPLGPDLSSARPLWGDGSIASIRAVITSGVAEPKQYRQAMPAMGGSQLSAEQVGDLAAWIAALRASPRPH